MKDMLTIFLFILWQVRLQTMAIPNYFQSYCTMYRHWYTMTAREANKQWPLGGPQSRSGRSGEEKILDPTKTWTPTPRSSSPYLVAIPTVPSVDSVYSKISWKEFLAFYNEDH
jgi:hypothetical protein